jgi:hypothetical protein
MKALPSSRPPQLYIIAFRVLAVSLLVLVHGCYSVRISNSGGVPEPDPTNAEAGFYHYKSVTEIDTTIRLKLLENDAMFVETCPEGCFHSVEYRVTLGAALLSGITLGKVRKVKVKYVCLKESNE